MQTFACNICGLQYPLALIQTVEAPVYYPQNDITKLTPRKVCKSCSIILTNIKSFAEYMQLQYCSYSVKSSLFDRIEPLASLQPKKSLQLYYAAISQSQQRMRSKSDSKTLLSKRFNQPQISSGEDKGEESIHPYVLLIVEQLRQKNYLLLSHLPKTLQYLVHLSCTIPQPKKQGQMLISPQERHQKLKNVILFLTQKIHLSIEELPYVVLLANYFLCLMDPARAITVLVQLSNIIISYPHLVSWKSIILQHQKNNYQTPLSPATLDLRTVVLKMDKLWSKVEAVIELGYKGEHSLRQGLIRLSKLDQTIDFKDFKKKVHDTMKGLSGKDQTSIEQLSMLYLLKIERNSFSLILRQILQQEQKMKKQSLAAAGKFHKEKEEYIDKIVNLKNRIQQLQNKIKQLTKKIDGDNIQELAEKSNEKDQEIEDASQYADVVQIVLSAPPKKKDSYQHKVESVYQTVYLQNILTFTDLFGFNDRFLGEPSIPRNIITPDALSESLTIEVQKLQQAFQKSLQKIKVIQQQKNRLLGIISRKQDRLIGVITQKDVIIQRYQQALWKMQNGIEVTQQPLGHRIRYIMHIFGKKGRSEQVIQCPSSGSAQKKGKDCEIY